MIRLTKRGFAPLIALAPVALVLGACVPADAPRSGQIDAPRLSRAMAPPIAISPRLARAPLPAMKSFAATGAPRQINRSNRDLTLDFLALSFALESGRALPRFTRFEGPITLRLTGSPGPTVARDLSHLVGRLRSEAGIPIAQTQRAQANITIQLVPRRAIRKVLPQAACFVAPNVTSLSEYRQARRSAKTNWALLTTRQQIAIFVPHDAPPQEIRDCLHEELAQALGPLNDLYRLPNSVFNDDNIHTVLTSFDMMMLRATYHPALRSGMSKEQVANALPAIFAQINPAGTGRGSHTLSATPPAWTSAIHGALGRDTAYRKRKSNAAQAVAMAANAGWHDHRRGFAHYAMARVLQPSDPRGAETHYAAAHRHYGASADTALHRAYTASHLAAYALKRGDAALALRLIGTHPTTAHRHQNAALLAILLMMKSEALARQGNTAAAQAARLDSMGWARYGFGSDLAVRAKLAEIAALGPRP